MEVQKLDFVLVSLGLFVFVAYHTWLVIAIKRNPRHTVIGLNAESRSQWVFSLMAVRFLLFTLISLFFLFFSNFLLNITTIVNY